jgi:hypothetical protein
MFHSAIDCSDDGRLLVLSEEMQDNSSQTSTPTTRFGFIEKKNGKVGSTGKIESSGKIRRQSVQPNPELKIWNIGGIVYVVQNSVTSGALNAAVDAIASLADV